MTQNELKAWLVLGSGSALHRHLAELQGNDLIAKRRLASAPRRVEYQLTAAGRALATVVHSVETWLARHPDRPAELLSPLGWRAFTALNEAWQSNLLSALVLAPRVAAELQRPGVGEEKLHRDLLRLLGAGLLVAGEGGADGEGYAISAWTRVGFAPLAAAYRWEWARRGPASRDRVVGDATVALLATLPLARPGLGLAGTCSLTVVEDGNPRQSTRAGTVWAEVQEGRVRRCGPGPPPVLPAAWMRSNLEGWLAAVLDGRPARLQVGGETLLATSLVRELHFRLCVSSGPAALSR